MTYFGPRVNPASLKLSQNAYDLIGSYGVNFKEIQNVPHFYVKMLLTYIIQASKAFNHAHKYGLIHGNFNLSKVLV